MTFASSNPPDPGRQFSLCKRERPQHDWGDKTAWRLFNAATFALSGKVAERPALTQRLHDVLYGVCDEVVVH
jgi:hypothetical protein